MIKNVGCTDKAVRVVLGGLLLVYAFMGEVTTSGAVLMVLGAAALFYSAYTSHCMGYKLLGMSTCADCTKDASCEVMGHHHVAKKTEKTKAVKKVVEKPKAKVSKKAKKVTKKKKK